MRYAAALIAIAACKSPPPAEPVEAPRLDAVETCVAPAPMASTLPVPVRPADAYPWAELGFHDASGWHPATYFCDLPSRVIMLATAGKGGTAWSLQRSGAPVQPVSIQPASKGCTPDSVTCSWIAGAETIDTLKGSQWIPTSGWVHGVEDMCRALPDDTIAVCSTAHRLAYVEVGCGDKKPLQLGLHDESLPRRYDLDVEIPVARLYGAGSGQGARWEYQFAGDGKPAAATLTFDLAAHKAWLQLDGSREDCLAYGLYRR